MKADLRTNGTAGAVLSRRGKAWWPGDANVGGSTRKTDKELRKFALVVALPLAGLGSYLMWKGGAAGYLLVSMAVLLLLSAGIKPRALAPVERVWMKAAGVMAVVMTHVILTLTFFLVITPVGFLVRLSGRSGLKLGSEPERETYWEPVEPDGPAGRPDKPF